jgi:hypothetical protein
MILEASGPVISLMFAVPEAQIVADWYTRALGATNPLVSIRRGYADRGGAPFWLSRPSTAGIVLLP